MTDSIGLTAAQRKLADYVQGIARDREITPGVALAALRRGHDGADDSEHFGETWDLTVADLDHLAGVFVAVGGFELIERDEDPGKLLPSDPPLPLTASDVLQSLAAALEALPCPFGLTVRMNSGIGVVEAWFHERDELEQWRMWLGAAPILTAQWEPSSTGGSVRFWRASVMWGRHEVELTWPEHRSEPPTPAERRERLAAEIAEIDRQSGQPDLNALPASGV